MPKPGTVPNVHVFKQIVSIIAETQYTDLDTVSQSELPISKTDLDSHVNMVVTGINFQIISDTSGKSEFSLFTPDYEPMDQVLIVDDTIRHDDEHTTKRCMLIVRNTIGVLDIDYNLFPPFVIREANVNTKNTLNF